MHTVSQQNSRTLLSGKSVVFHMSAKAPLVDCQPPDFSRPLNPAMLTRLMAALSLFRTSLP